MTHRATSPRVLGLLVLGILMVGSACRLEPAPTLAPASAPAPEPNTCPSWLIPDDSTAPPFEHAAEPLGRASIDASRRWLATSTSDGVAIYRLADGHEVALEPLPTEPGAILDWAWSSEPGRLVLLTSRPSDPNARSSDFLRIWSDPPHESTMVALAVETGERSTLAWSREDEPVLRSLGPMRLGPRATLVFSAPLIVEPESAGKTRVEWLDAGGSEGSWSFPISHFEWSADAELGVACASDGVRVRWRTTELGERWLPKAGCPASGERTILFRDAEGRLVLRRSDDQFMTTVPLTHSGEAAFANATFDAEERTVVWAREGLLHVNDTTTGELLFERELGFEIDAIAHVEPDCGVLLVDTRGRRRWLPTTATGEPERVVGIPALARFAPQIQAGSLAGELLVSHYRFTQASPSPIYSVLHWKRGQPLGSREIELAPPAIEDLAGTWLVDDTLVATGKAGLQRLWPEPAGPQLAWPETKQRGDFIDHRSALGPDARWLLAISRPVVMPPLIVRVNESTLPSGRMHMYDLRDDSLAWSASFDPHVTAIALTDDELWLARGPRSSVRVEVRRLTSGKSLRTLTAEGLEGRAIVALRPAGDRIYALLEPNEAEPNGALIAWTDRGQRLWSVAFDRPSSPRGGIFDIYEAGRDLDGRWLRVASDGSHLIVERDWMVSELWSVSGDPIRVRTAKQLAFGDAPDTLLAEVAHGRFEAWSLGTGERRWTVQLDGDGNVHFRPNCLRQPHGG